MTIRFRPITARDIPTLHRWRNMPHISQWWDPSQPSFDEARAEYLAYLRRGYGVDAYIILHDDAPTGYIQRWRVLSFPDYQPYTPLDPREVGIDVFIGEPDKLHQGLGTRAIRQFLREHVFDDPAVPACIIDPLPENAAAIRAYEKVGFVHVTTFAHDGKDVYLMRLPRPTA